MLTLCRGLSPLATEQEFVKRNSSALLEGGEGEKISLDNLIFLFQRAKLMRGQGAEGEGACLLGAHFTYFTGTKVQILTLEMRARSSATS
jgi:hypothetical protein